MIISDFHMHSTLSTDGVSALEEMVKLSIEKGLKKICITEHMDYDSSQGENEEVRREYPDDDNPFVCDTAAVFAEVMRLRAIYSDRIELLFGMELGLHPRLSEHYKNYVKEYPFDFLIGSSHEVGKADPYFPEFINGRHPVEAYREYFSYELSCAKACSGSFDVYGHLDYALRYHRPEGFVFDYAEYSDILEELLAFLISSGAGIEMNTGGFAYFGDEPNPHIAILKRYRELGGEIITIGSDAHKTGDVARYFDRALSVLKLCGFKHYTVFKERNPEFIKVD